MCVFRNFVKLQREFLRNIFLSGEPPNYKNHQQLTVLPLSPSQITPTTTPPKNYGMSPRMVSPPQRAPPPYHPPPPPSTVIYHNGSKLVRFFFSLSPNSTEKQQVLLYHRHSRQESQNTFLCNLKNIHFILRFFWSKSKS